jgi:hypothetical protein
MLTGARDKIPCGPHISKIPGVYITDCLGKMLVERLQEKTAVVNSLLLENKYDWEDTLYRFTGKAFGFKVNEYPFEALVRTTPLFVLMKYRERPLTVNAILFGQAGFLEDLISEDDYYNSLQREYRSIKKLLPARVLGRHSWKFMGSRPANFPTLRISQFASLITGYFPLFSYLLENLDLTSWQKVLELGTELYWKDHYLFGKSGRMRKVSLGSGAIGLLILNSFIPVFFQYAAYRKRTDISGIILSILEKLPPENNRMLERWEKYRIKAKNSFDSQAIIHLTTRYCDRKRCLECLLGNKLIRVVPGENFCLKEKFTATGK